MSSPTLPPDNTTVIEPAIELDDDPTLPGPKFEWMTASSATDGLFEVDDDYAGPKFSHVTFDEDPEERMRAIEEQITLARKPASVVEEKVVLTSAPTDSQTPTT